MTFSDIYWKQQEWEKEWNYDKYPPNNILLLSYININSVKRPHVDEFYFQRNTMQLESTIF